MLRAGLGLWHGQIAGEISKTLMLFRCKQVFANCLYSVSPGLLGDLLSAGQNDCAQVWLLTILCHPKPLRKYGMFKLEASTAQVFLKCLNLPDNIHVCCLSFCFLNDFYLVCSTDLSSHMDKQLEV